MGKIKDWSGLEWFVERIGAENSHSCFAHSLCPEGEQPPAIHRSMQESSALPFLLKQLCCKFNLNLLYIILNLKS
jgi:hypothetical protein